jgi:hypothetical protein
VRVMAFPILSVGMGDGTDDDASRPIGAIASQPADALGGLRPSRVGQAVRRLPQRPRADSAMVGGMADSARSVKISDSERTGWSSERPRRPGEAERPPRPADVSVRGRVLAPSDRLRYAPGSLLLIACADPATRDAFCDRVVEDRSALLSMTKVQGLLQGRVPTEEIDGKARTLLDAAAAKRLAAGQTVVIALESLDPGERERYVRMAAADRRPRHLILVEAGKDTVAEQDRATLSGLRTAIDGGGLGQEGFVTSLRLGGHTVGGLKRIVFAPPPADD